ncbi:MAG: tetratricopeptide repeat protein, partial [Terriglobales bacterium]
MRNLNAHGRTAILAMTLVVLLAGCSRDPNVRKQKYLESGNRHFQEAKYREAAIQYLNAIQVDSRFAQAHYQLAQCYVRLELWNAAYNELLRTVELAPKNWKAHLDLGNMALAAGEYKTVQEHARLVLAEQPENVEAYILLANADARLGDSATALKEMEKALQLAPQRAETYLQMARVQGLAGRAKPAEESIKKALALDPQSVDTALTAGSFYQAQRRWPEAEELFRKAVALRPEEPKAWKSLATVFLAQHKQAEAEQVLATAKKTLQNNPQGYRLLGDLYVSLGDMDRALAEFESLYREHSGELRLKKNYIQLLIAHNRLDAASKLNDEILKANAKDVDGLIRRGQILNQRGFAEEALPSLNTALKSEPDSASAHYHLGVAFSLLGNGERAEKEWAEALRLRPGMGEAQQALAQVAFRKGDFGRV